MGEMQVPNDKLYGCQTARSIVNFPIGGQADKMPKQVIQGTEFLSSLIFEKLKQSFLITKRKIISKRKWPKFEKLIKKLLDTWRRLPPRLTCSSVWTRTWPVPFNKPPMKLSAESCTTRDTFHLLSGKLVQVWERFRSRQMRTFDW